MQSIQLPFVCRYPSPVKAPERFLTTATCDKLRERGKLEIKLEAARRAKHGHGHNELHRFGLNPEVMKCGDCEGPVVEA